MNRITFGNIIACAALALFLGGFAGCGNTVGSVDYQSYCSQLQDCSGGLFPFDSVGSCADVYRQTAENLSGSCQNAYIDLLNCQESNGVCQAPCVSESEAVNSNCNSSPGP